MSEKTSGRNEISQIINGLNTCIDENDDIF